MKLKTRDWNKDLIPIEDLVLIWSVIDREVGLRHVGSSIGLLIKVQRHFTASRILGSFPLGADIQM